MSFTLALKRSFVKIIKPLVNNYMPRRFIFLIDLAIVFVSANATFYLVSTATGNPFYFFGYNWQLWAIVFLQGVFFVIFKSYFGLVRYSSFSDAIKQLKVTAFCVVSLLIINQIYYISLHEKLILNAGVIIYGVFAFSLLFLFRVFVKRVYEVMNARKISSTAYILGTGHKDVALAESLIPRNSDKFSIVGFVDDHPKNLRTRIFNLPIYNIGQLKKSNTLADAIIVSDQKLKSLKFSDSDILSQLLDLKLKIYKLPKLQDWNGSPNEVFGKLKEIKIEDLLQRSPIKLDNKKLFSLYKDKVILVTGAAGSIGSEIVRQLIAYEPQKILLLDQAETPLHELTVELDKNHPNLDFEKIIANVRNRKRLEQVFKIFKPQVVFHGAAYKHVPMMEANAIESLSVNFQGTRNVSELSIAHNIERFVFVSTDKAVNPTNIMGASKRAAEIFIQSLANKKDIPTTFIITRFGNVLGSNGSVIPHFKKQIEEKGPVTVTHPEITRYFMTIDEACQLVLEAGGMGKGGEIYVFDMGSPIKIIDLAHHMIRLTGLVPNEDIEIKFTGLRPGEKLYEELLADKETTIPTHHEKILIAHATHDFDDSKLEILSQLLKAVKTYDCEMALKVLKNLVPEYSCCENQNDLPKKPNLSYRKNPNVA